MESSRRDFIKKSAVASAAVAVGLSIPEKVKAAAVKES